MIVDGFTFFNELDLLEVKLNEMSPVVDKFVLVEARQTFQFNPKPLYFEENKQRFAKFLHKIEHVIIDLPEKPKWKYDAKSDAWAREHYQRDQIVRGLRGCKPDDLIIVSDVDEILSAQQLRQALAERNRGDLIIFLMEYYTGFFDRRRTDGLLIFGPRMIEYSRMPTPQFLRVTRMYKNKRSSWKRLDYYHTRLRNWRKFGIGADFRVIRPGGWHFSSFGGWQKYREKISAYAHEEYKLDEAFKAEDAYFQEILQTTENVPLNELPAFVQDNAERFANHFLPKERAPR